MSYGVGPIGGLQSCPPHFNITFWIKEQNEHSKHNTYLRLIAGDVWGLTQGVTLGVTEGVTEGVPLGVDCADVVSLSSLKSPLGILSFCKDGRKTKQNKTKKAMSQTDNESTSLRETEQLECN